MGPSESNFCQFKIIIIIINSHISICFFRFMRNEKVHKNQKIHKERKFRAVDIFESLNKEVRLVE